MDLGIRGPFLDFFRHGEVARDVRLLAARGALAPQAIEQLALLVWLTDDPDPEVASVATETIDAIPTETLAGFLARSDVPESMRNHFETRGIGPGAEPSVGDEPLIETPTDLPDTEGGDDDGATPTVLSQLKVIDRMKLALKGTREQRAALVRDPNKLVSSAVISSPKLTEAEVEAFAKMTNVSEEVLRVIGNNRSWMRNYGVLSSLAKNPKAPIALSLRLVSRLNSRDVKHLTRDRNVPDVVRQAANRLIAKTNLGSG